MMTAAEAREIIDRLEALEKRKTKNPYFPRFTLDDIQDVWTYGHTERKLDPTGTNRKVTTKRTTVDTYKDDKKGTRFFTIGDDNKGIPEEITACIQFILDERMKGNIR